MSNQRVNIANINSEEYDDMSVISMTVYISGIDELNKLCAKLEVENGVINVIRLRNLTK